MRRRRRRRGLNLERSGPWIGAVGLLMVLWCSISTVLFAPWWGVLIAIALVVPQVWLVARWARRRPTWCIWVPVAGVAVWIGYAVTGAQLLDWSA